MRRTEAKGRDAMQRQVELYHDSSDVAKFDFLGALVPLSFRVLRRLKEPFDSPEMPGRFLGVSHDWP